jgi:hypothetical protein
MVGPCALSDVIVHNMVPVHETFSVYLVEMTQAKQVRTVSLSCRTRITCSMYGGKVWKGTIQKRDI